MSHAARPLFACWHEVGPRIRRAATVALFLDFDGTLAPLHPRPDEARLGAGMRCALRSLRGNPRFRIFVITGRRRNDVRDRIRIVGIRYRGLHGWEGVRPAVGDDELRPLLDCLKLRLTLMPGIANAVRIEDKGAVMTIHRAADAASEDILRMGEVIAREIERLGQRFRILAGIRSWEIVPSDWKDKGAAVRRELKSIHGDALPIYLGDESTDEPAFAVLKDGITVRVGPPEPTLARYRLPNVVQVRECLERLQIETSREG